MKPDASQGRCAAAPQKPLRFVHNLEGPFAKRRRINTACLTCRRRKIRCSGEQPKCRTCQRDGFNCGYATEGRQVGQEGKNSLESGRKVTPDTQNDDDEGKKPPRSSARTSAAGSKPDGRRSKQVIDPQLMDMLPLDEASRSTETPSSGFRLRNKMPYFRYFGPTAIMPGFKQMVVKVTNDRHGSSHSTLDHSHPITGRPIRLRSADSPPAPAGTAGVPSPLQIPLSEAADLPSSILVTHLCALFFDRLGCTFPFLQRERFLCDLEGRQVDAILVNAVCALAARFSNHSWLDRPHTSNAQGFKVHASERGQYFAQRAKSAIPDAFSCPSVAVVQAALLVAYDEFGASRDSGLWMYLGIAIRMAQDLGMHTRQGLKFEGLHGPTPQFASSSTSNTVPDPSESLDELNACAETAEHRAAEEERLNTFWAIFFLDRVISSGTGRPATLRDCDIEVAFPSLNIPCRMTGWPSPFPAVIRIIHLYGCVADIINRVKGPEDLTIELKTRLVSLEDHLTAFYQNLSPRLHFNAVNFKQYVKLNQGPNFLILHYWFHALIVLLHQPTLLKTFEGNPQSLSTNSRELSMSSAKTIADIIAFTDLIDAKAGFASPFASQPVYIAACAFLKESAVQIMSSRPPTQPPSPSLAHGEQQNGSVCKEDLQEHLKPPVASGFDSGRKQVARHSLLASAAKQNYQRCYRALRNLESYWAGVKYIVTVVNQKAEGVPDPVLYTREEIEDALEAPRLTPTYTRPGWRRKLAWGTYPMDSDSDNDWTPRKNLRLVDSTTSPAIQSNQALGWSLTGTLDSPSTNVAVMYSFDQANPRPDKQNLAPNIPTPQAFPVSVGGSCPNRHESLHAHEKASQARDTVDHPLASYERQIDTGTSNPDSAMMSDADLLLNLHSQLPALAFTDSSNVLQPTPDPYTTMPMSDPFSQISGVDFTTNAYNDMLIDTQNIDMSLLGAQLMPWDLDYLPSHAFGLDVPFDVPPVAQQTEPSGRPD